MTDDERSKRPTLKTMPEAPNAKARETPQPPQPARTITERGSAPGGSNPAPAVSLDTDKGVGPVRPSPTSSSPKSNPPSSKPASQPPRAREPGGDETSVERPRGFRAETPTTEPEVRDSMEDMQTHVFDSGKFQRREQANINDTIKDSDNVMPVSGPHALGSKPPEASVSGSMAAQPLPAPPMAPRPMPVQPKVTARAAEMVQPPQLIARSRMLDDSGDFRREVATPVKAISMKTPGEVRERADTPARAIPQVKLRSMDEVRAERAQSPAQTLGYFAPPRDAAEVRSRRRSEVVVWASVCVILACAVALGIWFLAK